MEKIHNKDLGKLIKQRRAMVPLTLRKLSAMTGISPSHLGRIERGERFPSAAVLKKISKPLGFEESEIFYLAGYLSPNPEGLETAKPNGTVSKLDFYVSRVLSNEPPEVQHTVIGILSILKSIAKTYESKNDN